MSIENDILPAAVGDPADLAEAEAGQCLCKMTCTVCGHENWLIYDPPTCQYCRHQLILAAMASLGGGLPPEKMAEMSIKAADAVLRLRMQGSLDGETPQVVA